MTIRTNYKYNYTKAENELLAWSDVSPDMLTHKPTGKAIYQMEWYELRNSQPITDETIKAAVTKFWAELAQLNATNNGKHAETEKANNSHGYGWCNKCNSYCYGDCEA